VAVTTGTVAIADNRFGGLALLLDGQDGYTYYYGHLSEQWVEDGQLVGAEHFLKRLYVRGVPVKPGVPDVDFVFA